MPTEITPPNPPRFTITTAERDALQQFVESSGNLSSAQLSQAARLISKFILAVFDVTEYEKKIRRAK
jgi:hypothetical protein